MSFSTWLRSWRSALPRTGRPLLLELLEERSVLAAPSFAASTDFSTDYYSPRSVAVGDFNGDGKQDLATAYFGTDPGGLRSGVSVLLGNGNGTFAPRADFATGHFPRSVAVGDFNADGRQDLAISLANSVSVLLNTTVTSPGEIIDQVADEVTTLGLSSGVTQSLLSKLDAAKAAMERANDTAARNQIEAVIRQLNGLVKARKLDGASAADLTSELEAALYLL
jgi:hypothetical protein